EAERADNPFAVLQLELLLDWFAVAGRRRYVDDAAGVSDPEVGEEHARRSGTAGKRREHRIGLAQPRRREVFHFLLPLHPAVGRDYDDIVLFDDEVVRRVFLFAGIGFDGRAPFVAILLGDLFDFRADEFPAAVLVLEQRVDLTRAFPFLLEFVADDQNFEPREAVDLQFEDRVGLLGVELEPLHDLLRGVGLAVRLADDLDDFVERVEDGLEAFEDVNALFQRGELVLEPFGDDLQAEVQEVPENLLQVETLGPADFRIL